MASILDRYGIKEVADVTVYHLDEMGEPDYPVLFLDTLKVSTIEQTASSADATGGKGNAKLYYNEQEGIWFLHCFVKCGSLTTFDYVERIIVNRNKEYDSVYDFLLDKLGKAEFLSQYKGLRDNIVPMKESEQREKNNYITNIYNETDDVVEFIEKLYTVDGEGNERE